MMRLMFQPASVALNAPSAALRGHLPPRHPTITAPADRSQVRRLGRLRRSQLLLSDLHAFKAAGRGSQLFEFPGSRGVRGRSGFGRKGPVGRREGGVVVVIVFGAPQLCQ